MKRYGHSLSLLLLVVVVGCPLLAGCPTRVSGGGDDDADVDAGDGSDCASILDEAACRARTDCVADTCFVCTCTPSFQGCRAPDAAPYGCPEVGCAQPPCCGDDGDCVAGSGVCAPPGSPWGCGACLPGDSKCQTDGDCVNSGTGEGMICEPVACSCTGANDCVPGCLSDDGCGVAEVCSPGHRCVPAGCGGDGDCPPYFGCATGSCARLTCAADADCGGGGGGGVVVGYCVQGLCYESLGMCTLPVP